MSDFEKDFAAAMDMMSMHNYYGHVNVTDLQLEYTDDAKEFIDKVGELKTSMIIDKHLGVGKTKELLKQEINRENYKRHFEGFQIDLQLVLSYYRRVIFSFMKDAEYWKSPHRDVNNIVLGFIRRELNEYLYRDGKDYSFGEYGQNIMDSMIVRRTNLVCKFKRCLKDYKYIEGRFVDHGFTHYLLYGGTMSNNPNIIYRNAKVIDGFKVNGAKTKEDLYAQVCAGAAPNLGFGNLVKIWCMNVSHEEILDTALTALTGPFTICGRTFDSEAYRYLLIKNLIFVNHLQMKDLTEEDVKSIMGEDYERLCKSAFKKDSDWISGGYGVVGYKVLMCALRDERVRDFLIQYLKNDGLRPPFYEGELGCFYVVENPNTGEYELIKPTAINTKEHYSNYVRWVLAKSLAKVEGAKEPILVRDAEHYKYLLGIEEPSLAYALNGAYFYLRNLAIENGATTQQELIDVADKFYDGIDGIEQLSYAWSKQLSEVFYQMTGMSVYF